MPGIGIGISPFLKRKNNSGGGGTPTSTNATVQAWLNKIGTDGYTYPTQVQVNIYTTAWDYADAQGLTTKFDLVGLLKVPNQNLCKIPFIHSAGSAARFILVNNPVFTPNVGINGQANSAYLNTNWTESVDAINFVLGNGSIGARVINEIASSGNSIGANDEFGGESSIIPDSGGGVSADVQSFSNFASAAAILNSFTTIGVNSGNLTICTNGSQGYHDVDGGSYLLCTQPYYICCFNGDGVAEAFINADVQFFYAGSGSIDQAKLNTFVNMLLL